MRILEKIATSPSRTLTVLLAAFCVGIALGSIPTISFPFEGWVGNGCVLGISLFLVFFYWKKHALRLFVLVVFTLCLGLARGALFLSVPEAIAFDSPVQIQGHVFGEVEQRLSSQRVTLAGVSINGRFLRSNILIHAPLYPIINTDDVISLNCALRRPEPIQGFLYDLYLKSRGVEAICQRASAFSVSSSKHSSVSGMVLRLKQFLVRRLALAIPEPASTFLVGLVFGGASGLSPDVQDVFSKTGTSHVLAASGFNVSLFTAVFLAWVMETRLGRRRGIAVTFVLLAAYVIMAGAVPAVMRAALMGSVLLVGAWTRRKADTVNLLLLAAVIMLAVNPIILFADPGFQLSFVATSALIFVSPHWEKFFLFIPRRFGLRESFVTSLAACVLTIPISLWHFASVSAIAPLANLFVLPFVPALMFLGLAAFGGAVIHPFLGMLIGLPAWAGSILFLRLIQIMGATPFARMPFTHPHLAAVLSIIPLSLLLWHSCKTKNV